MAKFKKPLVCLRRDLRLKDHSALVQALKEIGYVEENISFSSGEKAGTSLLNSFSKNISQYHTKRDYPDQNETSKLSIHLRFETISIRSAVRMALIHKGKGAEVWLDELIWREFYQHLLDLHPQLADGSCFKTEYNKIRWPEKEEHFEAWQNGQTGYPLIDATMRHFKYTGWMHNRLRMVVASFLVKDLLIDWRKGEDYFKKHLNDYDFAANNGRWQWGASTGGDAQPYFRIFTPVLQFEKLDKQGGLLKKAQGNFIRRAVNFFG